MSKLSNKHSNQTVGIHRILHTMLRVKDLERSEHFYIQVLGMKLLRRKEYPEGRFTLSFLGYGEESSNTVLELTHNWDEMSYDIGNGFGHVALAVSNIYQTCKRLEQEGVKVSRPPGPMKEDCSELIAFIQDPDGYQIELIERG